MDGENKTLMLKAVNVEIETLRSNLEDKPEEVKDLQQKVKELVAIVRKSETKVFVEDTHDQKDTSRKYSKVNDNSVNEEYDERSKTEKHSFLLKCKICEINFDKFCDLERHIKSCHEQYQEFVCENCDKKFVTKWRLKKHTRIHSNKSTRNCHFFNNCKTCPFEHC